VGTVAAPACEQTARAAIATAVTRPVAVRRAVVAAALYLASSAAMRFPERVETERLVLRRWRDEDAGAWVAVWSDPSVNSALRPGAAYDPDHAEERRRHHLDHWEQHGFGLWAAEDRASGEVAGWVGPAHPTFVPELAEEVEIGWTLRSGFRGRGLATEGARAAVRAAFEQLALTRVISLIAPANEHSIRVAERLGMRPRGEVLLAAADLRLGVYELSASSVSGRASGAAADGRGGGR
jgi:RimJ/RimL family protein N-acetyltransferase